MHISKKENVSLKEKIIIRAIAILLSLVVAGIVIISIVHLNPIKVYESMFQGAFSTNKRIWITIRDTMLLTCIAIGLAPAYKMKFWNIGAEGQVLVGGIASAFFMINFKFINPILLLFIMAISSMIAGSIWGFIPGISKAKFGTNETLFTLMMNYIAIQFTSFMVSKWENPPGSNSVGAINSVGQYKNVGWIGNLFSDGYNSDYAILAICVIILAVLMYIYLKYTKQGFEISVIGDSIDTARYSGMRIDKIFMRTMALSGALCGLAGFFAVSASSHTISTQTAGGRGFTAIIVAWLAKMNPFIMILISLLITFLNKGAVQIASDFGLNEFMSDIITGIILFFILGSEFFIQYDITFKKKEVKL